MRFVSSSVVVLSALAVLLMAGPATAGIGNDLANATIVEDFLFNDAVGTDIPSAANSAGTGHLFDADTEGDTAAVATNGSGQLNVSLKNNDNFGTNYFDNDDITTGRVLGVMELTWDFDPNVFNGAEEEYVRISIIDRDPRSTFITAEFEIHRRGLSEIDITGASYGVDSTTIAATSLNISQSTKFIAVIDADLNNEVYSVHFSDDAGASFTTIGSGTIGLNGGFPRKALSTRMTLNNDFSGDNVLIDRIYLATIPEPTSIALVLCGLVGLAVTRRRV